MPCVLISRDISRWMGLPQVSREASMYLYLPSYRDIYPYLKPPVLHAAPPNRPQPSIPPLPSKSPMLGMPSTC
jgi:hypothetical protein